MMLVRLALLLLSIPAGDEGFDPARDWPQFRGHEARGISASEAPLEWDVASGENVAWRVPVAGLAHAGPVVWGERVFVTTAVRIVGDAELSSLYGSPGYGAGDSVPDEGEHAFLVLCLDKQSGELLWTREAYRGVPAVKRHPKSTHSNSTPACDAKRVLAFFASEGLYAYDHEGELLWKKSFGVLDAGAPVGVDETETDGYQWGFASSPVLHDGKVIVQCDVQGPSFVAVLDAATGEELWRTARDEAPTWSSPTVCGTGEDRRTQVVLNGYRHIGGYDLATGKELWKLVGGGDVPVPTPVVDEGLIFITSSHGRVRPIYAVRVDARGELEADAEACEAMEWCHLNRGVYMQTPLVHDGLLYCCSDGGILSVYDALSGDTIYRERVGDGRSGFSASAVAAGEQLYFTAEDGTVHVVRAGPEFERLARNELDENCLATPAISDGRLYFRTRHHLVCVE